MGPWTLPPELVSWITQLTFCLDARSAWRLLPLVQGMLFAQGRRTVTSWLRAADLGYDFRRFYYLLGSVGRKSQWIASALLCLLARHIGHDQERILLAIDDTPTKRYGPYVEGAGVHHNPTPGPAEQKFLYGHSWVSISWCVHHALWGTIGLPLRALLYVRQKQMPLLHTRYGITFRTKLEMAVELVLWAVTCLDFLGKKIWVVADGGYAKQEFLKKVVRAGVVVVSRLRCDAALKSVPVEPKRGSKAKRGRKRKYGKEAISLAKRAGHKEGWQTVECLIYGKTVTKTYKTFEATYAVVGQIIRVVLVREEHGWFALFCTDKDASVKDILEAYGDRSVIEQNYHDVKEVHGAGEQQVRHYYANIASFNLCLWLYTLIEMWAWQKSHKQLCDRSQSPWDDAERRPSHADKRNSLRRESVHEELKATTRSRPISLKIRRLVDRLNKLVS